VKVDADTNKALAEEFGVEGFPSMMYLKKGTLEKTMYEDARDSATITTFLEEKAGAVGSVEVLQSFVVSFMTNKASRPQTVKETEAAVKELTGADAGYGEYYLKIMAKLTEKGDEFAGTEVKRLSGMITGGSLRPEKEAEFATRVAALKDFAAAGGSEHTEL